MQPTYQPGAPMNPELLPDHPMANGAQTLGIISMVLALVGFGVVAPFAFYRAWGIRSDVRANPGVYRQSGPVQIAFLTSAIGSIIFLIATLAIAYVIFSTVLSS